MSVDDAQALRRHRALADPSRARIVAELSKGGPLDARELAGRLGLHINTVRVHLSSLAQAGLIVAETTPPRGRGRPRLVYRAIEDGEGDGEPSYRLLAQILAGVVAHFGADATAPSEEIGEAWGRYLAVTPPPFASVREDETIAQLVELLSDLGFDPELASSPNRQRLLMRSCPFLTLARQHQDVICPIHLGLMRGALAELRATTTVTSLEPFVRPNMCIAHLVAGDG
jgi:predicted ArsR family transcriptional regulator